MENISGGFLIGVFTMVICFIGLFLCGDDA